MGDRSAAPGARNSAAGLVAYFGYGSLVNRATLRTSVIDLAPARLLGWRRFWRPRPAMPGRPAALLTVRREAGSVVDGVVVIDRTENLAAVDAREAHYRRVELRADEIEAVHSLPADCPLHVYEAEDYPPHPEPPLILQSYLDAVMQGFLAMHGEAGLRRFMAETHGFADIPLFADRKAPAYPRAVLLTEAERTLFDALCREYGPPGSGRGDHKFGTGK